MHGRFLINGGQVPGLPSKSPPMPDPLRQWCILHIPTLFSGGSRGGGNPAMAPIEIGNGVWPPLWERKSNGSIVILLKSKDFAPRSEIYKFSPISAKFTFFGLIYVFLLPSYFDNDCIYYLAYASCFTSRGPSIKYVTLEGEGVRESVTVCDGGGGVKSM